MTRPSCLAALVFALAMWALIGPAQAATGNGRPAPARAQLLGVDAYWLSVTNLERSTAFYRDIVGLSAVPATVSPARNATLQGLTATPGARIRSVTLRTGGAAPALRLLEFDAVRRKALHPHIVDPGATILQVSVSDLTGVLAAVARSHATIVTPGGKPQRRPDGTRVIVLADPDGFFVSVSETAHSVPASLAATQILTVGMQYVVAAPTTMVRFYRQLFGIDLSTSDFVAAGPATPLLAAPGAQWATTRATFAAAPTDPANMRAVQFVAFRHIARHTFEGRPQDPGTPALSLRVSNLPAALRAIHSAGLRVLSAGGQPVQLPRRGAAVLFRDPAGILIELVQP